MGTAEVRGGGGCGMARGGGGGGMASVWAAPPPSLPSACSSRWCCFWAIRARGAGGESGATCGAFASTEEAESPQTQAPAFDEGVSQGVSGVACA